MFKHTVHFLDFNGKKHTEDLYFHISSPEMVDLQFNPQVDGDLDNFIKEAIRSKQGWKLWTTFKLLVVNSYGRRSEDGERFYKKPEYTEEFLNSPAWEKFFEWLLLDSPDGTHAKEFYNSIMPERLKGEAGKKELESATQGKKSISDLSREDLVRLIQNKVSSGDIQEVETER